MELPSLTQRQSDASSNPPPEQLSNQNNTNLSQLANPCKAFPTQSRSLPSEVQIEIITATTVSSYRRLITLLLPIRYPDKFFKESAADASEASLARVAIWKQKIDKPILGNASSHKVVGGIQCRIEDVPSTPPGEQQLYIQTIAVLSPFRQLGIATHLLDIILTTAIKHHGRVTSVYAHVWEANQEALEWYERRGFVVEGELIQDYYRRLKPSRARVVRKRICVEDHLAVRRQERV